jgi:hypothetical protein
LQPADFSPQEVFWGLARSQELEAKSRFLC